MSSPRRNDGFFLAHILMAVHIREGRSPDQDRSRPIVAAEIRVGV